MQTITVSATKARQEFFDILKLVMAGKSFMIQKDNVLVANITPISDKAFRNRGLLKALKKASGAFTYSNSDNPLRRKGATDFLGKF